MKKITLCTLSLTVLGGIASLSGCSRASQAPDVAETIRKSMDSPNLKDVSVSQDREKGVVTLTGHVATEDDKAQAEAIARPIAAGQVLADQIQVLPAGQEHAAKTIDSDIDKGIENNLDAALIQNHLKERVKGSVSNSVVTLTGEVNSEARRMDAQRIAAAVPNVTQVVNEVQVKNQRASSQP
jgi:hyperosmotically inducible periplasmic protein